MADETAEAAIDAEIATDIEDVAAIEAFEDRSRRCPTDPTSAEPAPVDEPAGWGAALASVRRRRRSSRWRHRCRPERPSRSSPSQSSPNRSPRWPSLRSASRPRRIDRAGRLHDPSGRYELRYWDGSWTEHVVRSAVHRPAGCLTSTSPPLTMRTTSLGPGHIDRGARRLDLVRHRFVPSFFSSWFLFPHNDQLPDDLVDRIERPTSSTCRISTVIHHDAPWLASHLPRDIPILLPDFRPAEQRRTLADLGFREFVRTVDTEEIEIAPGVRVASVESSITDGPGGDSALVVLDGESILVDQNDCRTNDLAQLRAHGPVDFHWLQFSGAIWTMVYEMSDAPALAGAKIDSQFARRCGTSRTSMLALGAAVPAHRASSTTSCSA